ncbi:uncharacterized protein N7484_002593 [Penicillium longicatenatum]|uniref:uncharacterized protein n=1 Tax=Penicillium longicatenatum TaxID=1561947 RepID=UPI002546C3C6|nr:uncharacterized protein N7484_002593 [Penicillium longicatenatum]KAJ5648870.1 hypothetical protein N7484_002593 [Penicillium longicatenatum]
MEISSDPSKKGASLESWFIRKFRNWNVLKPRVRTAESNTSHPAHQEAKTQTAAKTEILETPKPIPLSELGPSLLFQLAAEVLSHSGGNPALTNMTGEVDDQGEEVLQEVLPQNHPEIDESNENFYDWMQQYVEEQRAMFESEAEEFSG